MTKRESIEALEDDRYHHDQWSISCQLYFSQPSDVVVSNVLEQDLLSVLCH